MLSNDTDLCVCLLQREEDGDIFTAVRASDIITIGPLKLLTSINVVVVAMLQKAYLRLRSSINHPFSRKLIYEYIDYVSRSNTSLGANQRYHR